MVHITFTDGKTIPAWAQLIVVAIALSTVYFAGAQHGLHLGRSVEPIETAHGMKTQSPCEDTDRDGVCDRDEFPGCVGENRDLDPTAMIGCEWSREGDLAVGHDEELVFGGILIGWDTGTDGDGTYAIATFHIPSHQLEIATSR